MTARFPNKVKRDLDGLIGRLIQFGICDDSNFSTVRKLGLKHEVSFTGAEHISFALKEFDYADIYRELAEKRSYNMKLVDGALLQLMYRFKRNRLLQHRLAFYPSPVLRPFQDDPEAYMHDELFLEIVQRRIVPFPLRFDFDDRIEVAVDIRHPRSHLSLGDAKGCRVPVTAPLTPRWFIEFILRNFYQVDDLNFAEGLPAHRIQFEESITPNEKELMHLQIPSGN